MQREGIFREMKMRDYYEKPSQKRAREKAEAVRRVRKLARKRAQREGLVTPLIRRHFDVFRCNSGRGASFAAALFVSRPVQAVRFYAGRDDRRGTTGVPERFAPPGTRMFPGPTAPAAGGQLAGRHRSSRKALVIVALR